MSKRAGISEELPLQTIQHICIWFSMRLGNPPAKTFAQMKQVFNQDSYSQSTVFRLHKEFTAGCRKVGDLPRSGRPRTGCTKGNIQVCKQAVRRNRKINIHRLTRLLSMLYGTVFRILHHDLSLKKCTSKFIPHELTPEQKCQRISFAVNFLDSYPGARRLKWLVTTDESWLHVYDPDTKQRNKEWLAKGEDRGQVVCRERSVRKLLMVPFFDHQGMVHVEYLRNGTVNKHVFKAMLQRAWTSVRTRRAHLWRNRQAYKLHMDNASMHTALLVCTELQRLGWNLLPHPPYSPDLSPCNFFLFPYLKNQLHGRNFGTLDNLLEAVETELGLIPSWLWKACFRQWCACCQKCIMFCGGYFEGMRNPPQ